MNDLLEDLKRAKEVVDKALPHRRLLDFLEKLHPKGLDIHFHPDDETLANGAKITLGQELGIQFRNLFPNKFLERGQLVFVDVDEMEKSARVDFPVPRIENR